MGHGSGRPSSEVVEADERQIGRSFRRRSGSGRGAGAPALRGPSMCGGVVVVVSRLGWWVWLVEMFECFELRSGWLNECFELRSEYSRSGWVGQIVGAE